MADWKEAESFDLKGWQKVRKARKKLAQSYKTDKRTRDGGVAPSLYADSLSKGLAVHPLSVFDNRITAVNLFNAIMSVTSVAVGIIQIEVQWSETEVTPASSRAVPDVYVPSNNSALVSLLQWINLFQCALLGIGVYRYYFLVLAKQQARGLVLSTEGLYEAGLLPTYLVETFLCVLCPPPGFSTVITWHGTGDFITKYHTNDLIVVMMLPRMFQVYRCFLDLYGLTSVSLHDVGKMYHVDVDSVYMTKVLFKRSPFKVLGFFTVFMLTVFAFAISIFERPSDLDFQYFRNCLWVAIVTWTTVGFGDVYPTTDFGRAAASLCCATSLFNLALLVMAVQDTFRMNTPENLVLATYETRRWRREMELKAVVVMQRFWRCCMTATNPLVPMIRGQWEKDVKLARAIRDFRGTQMDRPERKEDMGLLLQDTMLRCLEISKKVEDVLMLQGYM